MTATYTSFEPTGERKTQQLQYMTQSCIAYKMYYTFRKYLLPSRGLISVLVSGMFFRDPAAPEEVMEPVVLGVCLVVVLVVVVVLCMAGRFGVVPAGTGGGTTAVLATGLRTV